MDYDLYSFEEGSSTHFTIKCNNQKQEELEFYYMDDTLFWVGENASFIIYFKKISEFTTVDMNVFDTVYNKTFVN